MRTEEGLSLKDGNEDDISSTVDVAKCSDNSAINQGPTVEPENFLTSENNSDSESELIHSIGTKKKAKISLNYSDEESETEERGVSSPGNVENDVESNVAQFEGIVQADEEDNISKKYKTMFQNTDLYDAEGSSDEDLKVSGEKSQFEEYANPDSTKGSKKASKAQVEKKKSKGKTTIDEIHSETQRIVRQSRVSLPYHIPKQRSLADFLNRRKSTPVVPLRTCTDHLSKVWKHLEEREKTVEHLYKSDTDESDVEDVLKIDLDENKKKDHGNINNTTPTDSQIVDNIGESKDLLNNGEGKTADNVTNSANPCNVISSLADDVREESTNSSDVIATPETIEDNSMSKVDLCMEIDKYISETPENLIPLHDSEINDFAQPNNHQPEGELINEKGKNKNDSTDSSTKPELSTEISVSEELILEEHLNKTRLSEEQITSSSNTQSQSLEGSLRDIQMDITPRISGSPDSIINLAESPTKPGALGLIKRFIKHVGIKTKKRCQNDVKISIVSTELDEKGEIVKLSEEPLTVRNRNKEAKPGETLKALRATLQEAIALQREKQWEKKIQEYRLNEEELFDEGGTLDSEDILDKEEELLADENESESGSDSEEEEELECTKKMKTKKKKSSCFIDEEAEVSDDSEENDLDEEENSDDNENDEGEEAEMDDLNEESFSAEKNSGDYLECEQMGMDSLNKTVDDDILEGVRDKESTQCEEDLIALCSGNFTSQSLRITDLENQKHSEVEESEEFRLIYPEDTEPIDEMNKLDETKDDNDSSDDEIITKKTKKKKVNLTISDDEDEVEESSVLEENDADNNENITEIHENDENNSDEENVDDVESNQCSEEEIDENEHVNGMGFLDAEAELSGSEWESADEDENNLDDFEVEDGDTEEINEKKLQTELGKKYVKDVLDEDKREIRILQELLLEDGELHSDGPKRQRLYRWSNPFDEDRDGKFMEGLECENNGDEEEEEEVWRRTRYERETFLLEQNKKKSESDDEVEPEVKTIGMKPTRQQVEKSALLTSPDPKHPFKLLTKRGSFLNRGDSVLSKLAEITSTNDISLGKSKGKRKMVFAVVSPPKETPPEEEKGSKRKAIEALPKVTKKLKYSPSSFNKGTSILERLRQSDITAV